MVKPSPDTEETPSFLAVNLKDAKVLTTVPSGKEYKLNIEASEMKVGKNSGVQYIECRASIMDNPGSKNVFFPIFGPDPDADDAQRARYESDMKEMAEALNYTEPDGFHTKKLVGLSGWAILGEEEWAGQLKNTVQRWIGTGAGTSDGTKVDGTNF